MSDDPVSWIMIEPGWNVVSSDGEDVGHVDAVTGDENADIFDGLAIATSRLGKPRYVPSSGRCGASARAARLRSCRPTRPRPGPNPMPR